MLSQCKAKLPHKQSRKLQTVISPLPRVDCCVRHWSDRVLPSEKRGIIHGRRSVSMGVLVVPQSWVAVAAPNKKARLPSHGPGHRHQLRLEAPLARGLVSNPFPRLRLSAASC